MRALVADAFSEAHLTALRALVEVEYRPDLKAAELPDALAGVQILIVRSTEVSAQAIEAADSLALIVRAGAGTNTIDRRAASARAIFVANCPGQNAIAVAELVLGHLIALDRRLPDNVSDLHAGRWNKKEYSKADGLHGRTLGIVGLGAIGRQVAQRAQAFGMNVLAWSRSLTDEKARAAGVERVDTIEELCRRVDALTLHVALTSETKGLIGPYALAELKPRAILINTARAEVIDAAALERAIVEKKLRVALDVFFDEPAASVGEFNDRIGRLPNVYGSHHIGASTTQAQEAIAEETVRIVRNFVARGAVPNCVNLSAAGVAPFQLVVRHLDQVGVLAEVLGAIRRQNLNVEQMENVVFDEAVAACARIRLSERPTEALLSEIETMPAVLSVDLVEAQ